MYVHALMGVMCVRVCTSSSTHMNVRVRAACLQGCVSTCALVYKGVRAACANVNIHTRAPVRVYMCVVCV